MSVDLYPFRAGPIEPVVLPDQTVGVWVNKVYKFYKILYIEGIPRSDPMVLDLGALATTITTAITQLALLEMPDKELGQFRCFVLDDICASLWQGRADGRYKLANRNARVTRWTGLMDPDGHTTEFYVHEDDFAFVQVLNPTGYNLTQTRVGFFGFRYVLEELTQYSWKGNKLPAAWTRIPATAHL